MNVIEEIGERAKGFIRPAVSSFPVIGRTKRPYCKGSQ